MKKILLISCFCVFTSLLWGQKPPVVGKYWIEFKDKAQSPYCTCRPWEFLSARALARRARAGIAVVDNDLPVNPAYLNALRSKNVRIHHTSRWMNAATVITDSSGAASLRSLPFIQQITYVGRHIVPKEPKDRPLKRRIVTTSYPKAGEGADDLGYAGLQNSLLNLPLLYYAGVKGDGMWIAVMDGGFNNVDTMPFFDSIALTGRLFPGWDFVEHDGGIYESAQHGTAVLSVMGANLPGYFVGAAPHATYFLVKTEDTAGEYPVEETNWIAGAEWADSVGVDIINASLGYTSFNDTTLSHNFKQLDGKTAIGSIGAAIAATKGMIICNSAGNSGDEPWRYVGVPADAKGVIAVGAVTSASTRADFSSMGPTADGRIKPDLVAPGEQVVVAGDVGTELGLSNGTSLASPMLAGGLAALWSDFPEKNANEILEAVYQAADQNTEPDNERGYGLPNLAKAWLHLHGFWVAAQPNDAHADAFFASSRAAGMMQFLVFNALPDAVQSISLMDESGRVYPVTDFSVSNQKVSRIWLRGLTPLPPGAYQVRVVTNQSAINLLGLFFK
jgi:hypothetical protein